MVVEIEKGSEIVRGTCVIAKGSIEIGDKLLLQVRQVRFHMTAACNLFVGIINTFFCSSN